MVDSTKTARSRKSVLLTLLHGSATGCTDTDKIVSRETELLWVSGPRVKWTRMVRLHVANALKGLAQGGCAGSSYCVVIKFGPGPGLLSRMH